MLIHPSGASATYLAGMGINPLALDQLSTIQLSDEHLAIAAGAVQETTRNIANGFAGLDSTGAISGTVRVRFLNRAGADALVPLAGEIIVVDEPGVHECRFGNALMAGGYSTGISSPNTIVVPARGTAAENGQAISDAYTFAKTYNPYGVAKSASNPCILQLLGGVYDSSSPILTFDTPYIYINGMGPQTRWNPSGMDITGTNIDYAISNLTLYKSAVTTYAIIQRLNDAALPHAIRWENVIIEGAFDDTITSALSRPVAASSVYNIICRNVKTVCQKMWCATTVIPNHTFNMNMENCEFGNRFMGPSTTATKYSVGGTLRNVKFAGNTNMHFNALADLRIINCDWSAAMNYLITGVRIERTTFRTGAVASVGGVSAGQSVFIAHCTMAVANHATLPVTNLAGTDAQAMNVRSDS